MGALELLPATPDLSFPTRELRISISALLSLLLLAAPAGAICPALAFGRWPKGQTVAPTPEGIWEVAEGPDCGSHPRGHLSGPRIKGKRDFLLVLEEKSPQSPYMLVLEGPSWRRVSVAGDRGVFMLLGVRGV